MTTATKTELTVTHVELPICGHGFRSGYARARVNGEVRKFWTSRPATSDYMEHLRDVEAQFKAGEGKTGI
jgi:hypothetical protein